MNQSTLERRRSDQKFDLREVFNTFHKYKWSILLITLFTFLVGAYSLYFKPDIYSSTAVIEVKSVAGGTKGSMSEGDFLGGALSGFGSSNVNKDIEILKTFHVNNSVLNKLNFHTRYYVDQGLKKVEIYNFSPIKVTIVTIIDPRIIGRKVKLTPLEDGYQLQVENTFKSKMLHSLFNKEIIEFDDTKIYPYDTSMENDYFELTIEKKDIIDQPVYFQLLTSNREIFEGIKGNLNISQINPDAPLINITYTDTIPERADAYVNAVAESFILQSVAEKTKGNDRIIDFIDNQLSDIKTKLDNSEKKLENYRIENKAIDPTLQGATYIQEMSRIDIELSQNELKEMLMKNLLSFIAKGKNLDAMAPLLMELNDPSTLALITKLQEAQIKEEGLKAEYSSKHPGLIAVRKQIRYIIKKLILNVQNLKSSMSHRNSNLAKLKKSYDKNIESLPTQERILINLRRDYEVSAETYKYLQRKKSENEMIKVAILSDYRVIDNAYHDYRPISPKRALFMVVFLMLGAILGISQAFLRHFMNNKIQNKQDIENLTTLPIYGILPILKQNVIKLEVFKDPKSPFAESYRSLRTNLQFTRKEDQANVILVTSTIAGEGKSTTVANLGAIFQMANYKSIVINLDLRKPTLHHYFEVKNNAGLSTYLSGKNRIGDIIQSTQYKNLDIISSGPIPPNPSELILSDKLDELLDTLKEVYDYIFIDSAPLGLVTDTMHLMQYADTSLIVFRENYAQKSFVSDLNNLVKSHDLKHIGLVLNSVDISTGSYGYGYGYGYGEDDTKKKKKLF